MRKFALFMVAAFALGASAAERVELKNGQYYRLFAPLTFYHAVADNQLSIASQNPDEVSAAIDQALMHVYLNRPDLVQVTQKEQEEAGSLRMDIIEQTVVQQDVEMAAQDMPMTTMSHDSLPFVVMPSSDYSSAVREWHRRPIFSKTSVPSSWPRRASRQR